MSPLDTSRSAPWGKRTWWPHDAASRQTFGATEERVGRAANAARPHCRQLRTHIWHITSQDGLRCGSAPFLACQRHKRQGKLADLDRERREKTPQNSEKCSEWALLPRKQGGTLLRPFQCSAAARGQPGGHDLCCPVTAGSTGEPLTALQLPAAAAASATSALLHINSQNRLFWPSNEPPSQLGPLQ